MPTGPTSLAPMSQGADVWHFSVKMPHRHALTVRSYLVWGSLAFTPGISATAAQDRTSQIVNELRTVECPRHLDRKQQLKVAAKLNVAAKHIGNDVAIREALRRADYRAGQSAAIRLSGMRDDTGMKRMLEKSYCKTLTDPELTEIGFVRRDKEISIVLAAPFATPDPKNTAGVAREVLALVNAARAQPRRCGNKRFATARPLTLNDKLTAAATAHAKDMAAHNFMAHEGSDGSAPSDRATRANYSWKAIGENVAAGQHSAKEVVAGWLDSPGHCANIMDPDFAEMAVAFVVDPKSKMGIYWAQAFGKQRSQ